LKSAYTSDKGTRTLLELSMHIHAFIFRRHEKLAK